MTLNQIAEHADRDVQAGAAGTLIVHVSQTQLELTVFFIRRFDFR